MLKKNIFRLIAVLISTQCSFASTYINEESAAEGITRGTTESFTSSTGIVLAEGQSNCILKCNGVLIHPSLVLTNRHCLKKYVLIRASFWAMDNVGKAMNEIRSVETSDERKGCLEKYFSMLDLNQVYCPSDEGIDLAIVALKRPINGVKIHPLLLAKPKIWDNGFFVSYAPVLALSDIDKKICEDKRHIAVLDVVEDKIPEQISVSKWPFLLSKFQLEGELTDPQNRNFVPQKNEHRLKAFTQQNDSGAAFVVKKVDYYVAGLHKGRAIMPGKNEVFVVIIPLYPHKDWIESVIKGYQ